MNSYYLYKKYSPSFQLGEISFETFDLSMSSHYSKRFSNFYCFSTMKDFCPSFEMLKMPCVIIKGVSSIAHILVEDAIYYY